MEYIWNGNPSVWKFRAPILFPIVGRLKDCYFLWQGKEYHLPNHGFSRDLEHSVVVREKERVVWWLQDTPYTRELFPDPLYDWSSGSGECSRLSLCGTVAKCFSHRAFCLH
ncbi:MAG: hypothetical protein IKA80_02770 [Spirochaetaceae bacterium]|nr:hypothetical protein [Spirochaetaceae bacterium]